MTNSTWPEIAGVISDLDGVLYRGDTAIPEAIEAVNAWQLAGVPVVYVTNNSTRTAAEFAAKLTAMGAPTKADRVITTSNATAAHIRQRWPAGTGVNVVGSLALRQAMLDAGLAVRDGDVEVVVVGLDREISYGRLKTAVRALLAGAALIGTNPDLLFPADDGFEPGAGCMLAAIAAAAGITSPPVIGKPEPHLLEAARALIGTPKERTIMIGDQLATDIEAARRAGMPSVLVRTGVSARAPDVSIADFVVDSLADIPIG